MKTKIKKIAYGAVSAGLLFPALALAQWNLDGTAGQAELPEGTIWDIIGNLMKWLLGLVGFIGIIGFAIAGIWYLTAAGDEERIDRAKRAMLYSIIGVIVALIGFVAIKAIEAWLSGGSTQF